jgi:hypothetical protein
MKFTHLAAAAVLTLGLAGQAFAAASEADKNASPQGPNTQDPQVLGMDITGAGSTDASRLAFFNGMAPDQQASARSRCSSLTLEADQNASPQGPSSQDPSVLAFCKAVSR